MLEHMNRFQSTVAGITFVAAGVDLAWPAAMELFSVDACLDAGGSYNYAQGVCDLQQSHIYSPSLFHSWWLILIGFVLATVGLWIMFRQGRRA
jgi:hypothetical protein